MLRWGTTTGLRLISLFYLLSAAAFGFVYALQQHQPWAVGIHSVAKAVPPAAGVAAKVANEQAFIPAGRWIARTGRDGSVWTARQAGRAHAWIAAWFAPAQPVEVRVAMAPRKAAKAPAPAKVAVAKAPLPRPAAPSQIKPPVVARLPAVRDMQIVEPEAAVSKLPLLPAPDASPPSPGEIARVLTHLKVSLTRELYDNFELFLFVSKANHGPWQQRMFVFEKQADGNLHLLYTWAVSTGREVPTPGPSGNLLHTDTPQGYFQIDPERVFWRYRSAQWDHDMPHAMFFSWEHDGQQTGVAIHGAVGGDIALLGSRSSAGCVRIHPQNAKLLYKLILSKYRGPAPLFAYDRRTETMSKDGMLMHDKAGNLQYAEGFKVLVLIENTGGDDVVAALF